MTGSLTAGGSASTPMRATLSIQEVLDRCEELGLEYNGQGDRWLIQCPHPDHDDSNPSTSLWLDDEGRLGLNCWSSTDCDFRSMVTGLGYTIKQWFGGQRTDTDRSAARRTDERARAERLPPDRWESIDLRALKVERWEEDIGDVDALFAGLPDEVERYLARFDIDSLRYLSNRGIVSYRGSRFSPELVFAFGGPDDTNPARRLIQFRRFHLRSERDPRYRCTTGAEATVGVGRMGAGELVMVTEGASDAAIVMGATRDREDIGVAMIRGASMTRKGARELYALFARTGASLVIFGDDDGPGRGYAESTARRLTQWGMSAVPVVTNEPMLRACGCDTAASFGPERYGDFSDLVQLHGESVVAEVADFFLGLLD